MGLSVPVCFAEMFVVKAVAVLALCLVGYLYWTSIREKLERRRQRRWLEGKRLEAKQKTAAKDEPRPLP